MVFIGVRAPVAPCIVYPAVGQTAPAREPVIPSGCVAPDGMGSSGPNVIEKGLVSAVEFSGQNARSPCADLIGLAKIPVLRLERLGSSSSAQ
jgi:hypothetical protein